MQTFLPHADFYQSAEVLDRQRLGKQRVEGVQIMNALLDPDPLSPSGWSNHPATRMWRGYEPALFWYVSAMCDEWERRGYDNTKCSEWLNRFDVILQHQGRFSFAAEDPWWLGVHKFHESHRLKLMWKLPDHYSPFFDEPCPAPDQEPSYWWPNMDDQTFYQG